MRSSGITPAYAGNTIHTAIHHLTYQDHPRLRGERFDLDPPFMNKLGSSPPTRGTHLRFQVSDTIFRITPAYAGNTIHTAIHHLTYQDHPRLRGEHTTQTVILHTRVGSPPPTRGTRQINNYVQLTHRITPAYAGNTSESASTDGRTQDHPRLRGEHLFKSTTSKTTPGSPPPTRGTRVFLQVRQAVYRITPAYAGNTMESIPYRQHSQDHPRLRGEHLLRHAQRTLQAGSPPPTRGTPFPQQTTTFKFGSPPPTRGTLLPVLLLPSASGITPAYAGNTYCAFRFPLSV